MSEFIIIVKESDALKRLDLFIAEKTGKTRSQVQKLLHSGDILVNNAYLSQSYNVKANDKIVIKLPPERIQGIIPEPLPINIFYVDEYLAVVDKPSNMVIYPCPGHAGGTLLNAIYYRIGKLSSIGGPLRNGVVHRLDKDTSGVMVIALDDSAYYGLVEQFKKREINRQYIAIIYGSLKDESGEITSSIGRSLSDRKKMSTRTKTGKEAITFWRIIRRYAGATLIEARLGTGRMHQIRVHFASIGHPVLGDKVYGKKTFITAGRDVIKFPRQMLHASTLGFIHPITKDYLEFSSQLPEDILHCISRLDSISK